jgi:hypothetical protein
MASFRSITEQTKIGSFLNVRDNNNLKVRKMVEFEDEKSSRASSSSRLRQHVKDVQFIVTATSRPGFDFTNILRAAFTRVDAKEQKRLMAIS